MSSLANQHIVLGISGGIAAYKAPMLVRALLAEGAQVQVVMTANAHHFVTATSLQAVSGRPVREDLWDPSAEAAMSHIELARWADQVIIAPATANTLAQLAIGGAGDLLSTLCLATSAPVILAPAMNQQMYQHPATQKNLTILQCLGYELLGPEAGEQACGETGPGRMVEPTDIVEHLLRLRGTQSVTESHHRILEGRRVLITAGPTVEAIDPVRYISNHSSGRQGISVAEAALRAGAEVTLVAGPGVPSTSTQIKRIDVVSALDMQAAVMAELVDIDLFVGVAAVADYRPAQAHPQKLKRKGTEESAKELLLVENPDIIKAVANHASRPAVVVGFAAETDNTHQHATDKLINKNLDAVVLNDVSDPKIGFNSEHNAATLIHADGEAVLPLQTKQALSVALLSHIVRIFASQLADTNPKSVTE